jgi:hypothetical protein
MFDFFSKKNTGSRTSLLDASATPAAAERQTASSNVASCETVSRTVTTEEEFSRRVSNVNVAAACPYCVNYDASQHFCTLFGEPIPESEKQTNPCKGNKFNRKRASGNSFEKLRSLRG